VLSQAHRVRNRTMLCSQLSPWLANRTLFHRCCRSYLHSASKSNSINRSLAFAFDIDGVLCHGHRAIPAAIKALDYLDGGSPLRRKIPYLLITNGGGISEQERATDLSQILERQIGPERLIQSHTVLKGISHRFRDRPVLVLGGRPGIAEVASSYGFRNVHTSYSILTEYPGIWPFLDGKGGEKTKGQGISELGIEAIFVFHDPRDWGRDIQLMLDVLVVREGTGREKVELFFCNPDLWWKADYPRPRLGQGGFREAFQGVYQFVTGQRYPERVLGKPSKATFDYAKGELSKLVGEQDDVSIYMVGDNLLSDIQGANRAGWKSILVETGVYDRDDAVSEGLLKEHPPGYVAADVMEAVEWAVNQEMTRVTS